MSRQKQEKLVSKEKNPAVKEEVLPIERCWHTWKLFRDNSLKETGLLSFYCSGCLKLTKINRVYEDELGK